MKKNPNSICDGNTFFPQRMEALFTSLTFEVALSYMIRLENRDLQDEDFVLKLAEVAKMTQSAWCLD